MSFSPSNNIVKLCIRSMAAEEKGEHGAANGLAMQAWSEATDDLEKFLAAYFVGQYQVNNADRLKWLESALALALKADDIAIKSALSSLYSLIAKCYENLNDSERAKENYDLALSFKDNAFDKGPFYHGTKADLQPGDQLTAGYKSNYDAHLTMNHIYFTALMNGAGLAAELAKGDGPARVYIVEPTDSFENDPNVTDKKFPGNLTRSYRTVAPLNVVGEIKDWAKLTREELQKWNNQLANNKGKIIN